MKKNEWHQEAYQIKNTPEKERKSMTNIERPKENLVAVLKTIVKDNQYRAIFLSLLISCLTSFNGLLTIISGYRRGDITSAAVDLVLSVIFLSAILSSDKISKKTFATLLIGTWILAILKFLAADNSSILVIVSILGLYAAYAYKKSLVAADPAVSQTTDGVRSPEIEQIIAKYKQISTKAIGVMVVITFAISAAYLTVHFVGSLREKSRVSRLEAVENLGNLAADNFEFDKLGETGKRKYFQDETLAKKLPELFAAALRRYKIFIVNHYNNRQTETVLASVKELIRRPGPWMAQSGESLADIQKICWYSGFAADEYLNAIDMKAFDATKLKAAIGKVRESCGNFPEMAATEQNSEKQLNFLAVNTREILGQAIEKFLTIQVPDAPPIVLDRKPLIIVSIDQANDLFSNPSADLAATETALAKTEYFIDQKWTSPVQGYKENRAKVRARLAENYFEQASRKHESKSYAAAATLIAICQRYSDTPAEQQRMNTLQKEVNKGAAGEIYEEAVKAYSTQINKATTDHGALIQAFKNVEKLNGGSLAESGSYIQKIMRAETAKNSLKAAGFNRLYAWCSLNGVRFKLSCSDKSGLDDDMSHGYYYYARGCRVYTYWNDNEDQTSFKLRCRDDKIENGICMTDWKWDGTLSACGPN